MTSSITINNFRSDFSPLTENKVPLRVGDHTQCVGVYQYEAIPDFSLFKIRIENSIVKWTIIIVHLIHLSQADILVSAYIAA